MMGDSGKLNGDLIPVKSLCFFQYGCKDMNRVRSTIASMGNLLFVKWSYLPHFQTIRLEL